MLGYLKCALDNLYLCGTPVRVTLQVMQRIRLTIPKIKTVWEFSAMSKQGRDQAFQTILWAEEDIRAGIESGKFRMDDALMPEIPE